MAVLLNLFFNEYGLPSGYAWVFLAFVFVVIIIIIIQASYANDDEPAFKVLTIIALYFALFYSVHSMNPYNYIPISGSDIQKANLRRCIVDKTVNLENIEEIMTDCQRRDQELKFKTGIESLGK
ncbi:TPA: hypothetical protein ACFP4N_000531 [Neisseria subflava]|jgi:hypothetical protein